eukprot:scaffold300841_cov30-Tisochrysis_lutea.AAC.2
MRPGVYQRLHNSAVAAAVVRIDRAAAAVRDMMYSYPLSLALLFVGAGASYTCGLWLLPLYFLGSISS